MFSRYSIIELRSLSQSGRNFFYSTRTFYFKSLFGMLQFCGSASLYHRKKKNITGPANEVSGYLHKNTKRGVFSRDFWQGQGEPSCLVVKMYPPTWLDPYSIRSVDTDPDPYSESGSGSRRAKKAHKRRKNLEILFLNCWRFSFENWRLLL